MKCIKCGSLAFNLQFEGINQGDLCDVHYWQERAHRAEALLKLALRALETCGESEWYTDDDFGMSQIYDEDMVKQAITAIEEALAQPEQPAQQEPVAKVVSTAPERIWLDLGFAPSDEDEISFNDLVDATWSHDNATGFGIEYVRADIAAHGIKEKNNG